MPTPLPSPVGVTPAGLTPLFYAVKYRMPRITRYLLKRGEDPNAEQPGWPSLMAMAEETGHEEIIEALRKAGGVSRPPAPLTGPRWPTTMGFTKEMLPIYEAALAGDWAAAKTQAKKLNQKNVLIQLIEACIEGDFPLAKAMAAVCKDVDADSNCEYLHRFAMDEATVRDRVEIVQLLIDAGSRELLSGLYYASCGGHVKTAELLLRPEYHQQTPVEEFVQCAEEVAKSGYGEALKLFAGRIPPEVYLKCQRMVDEFVQQHGVPAPNFEYGEKLVPRRWQNV
jgi:hypothetical protein